MKSYFYFIILALLLTSCGGKKGAENKSTSTYKPPTVTTPNEQKAIKEISDFYAASCNFSTGVLKDGRTKFARLELSKSPTLDSAVNIAELHLSNIALAFYKDLPEERNNFDEIQSAIIFGDGQIAEKEYLLSALAVVTAKSIIVAKIVDLLKAQEYDGLDTLLDDKSSLATYNKKNLIDYIKKSDPPLGKIKTFVPYGFVFLKADNGKQVLHIAGLLVRDKQNNEFSVDIDPSSTKTQAIFINYKL